jgi:L-lactate dehydrogenase complex protein LldE
MLTCLCDAFYGEVGVATVRVLEHAGCTVEFDSEQTCCGQPAFNAGDWSAARPIAVRTARLFGLNEEDGDFVVTPSASCAAMLRHGYEMLGEPVAQDRAHELAEFLVCVLGRKDWGGQVSPRRVAVHRACHGRMIGLSDQQDQLLRSVKGIEIVEIGSPEQCCGFGGAFSITHGKVSEGIGLEKLRQFEMAGVDTVVSGDMGCLMHLAGLAKRNSVELSFLHFSQLLAEAIP